MKHFSTIIIGGGASGLFLTHLLPNALLLEKNSRLGLKVLASGGGKCNFTHDDEIKTLITKYPEKKNFVSPCLYNFPPNKIRNHFERLGIKSYANEENKIFPSSNDAKTIVNALEGKCKNIKKSTKVLSVRKDANIFIIKTENEDFSSTNLVIATGGNYSLEIGSSSDSYNFASLLGHQIIKPEAALAPIITKENFINAEGISLKNIIIFHNKKRYEGDILFTKKGISGPLVLDISRYISKDDKLLIKSCNICTDDIKKQNGKLNCINAICNITKLPKRYIETLIKINKDVASLNKADLNLIVKQLTQLEVNVAKKDEKLAMVTKGGVNVKEINSSTFESKLVNNLYIIGEALDVDGLCGGYNITFAFASAYSVYKSLYNN